MHLVWAVSNRCPLIVDAIERAVHGCIEDEASKLRCEVLEIGGMPDPVHSVVKSPLRLSVADLMKRVKGITSRFIHDQLPGNESPCWQEEYGVFIVTPSHVNAVKNYERRQKEHHANNDLHIALEEVDEEYTAR